ALLVRPFDAGTARDRQARRKEDEGHRHARCGDRRLPGRLGGQGFGRIGPGPSVDNRCGNAIIARLDALTGPEALEPWRQVIEDVAIPANFLNASAVWAAVRARPGFKETPYGLLVGREEDVVNVLKKASNYSVSEYGRRMSNSFGLLYLGQDPGHDYFKA